MAVKELNVKIWEDLTFEEIPVIEHPALGVDKYECIVICKKKLGPGDKVEEVGEFEVLEVKESVEGEIEVDISGVFWTIEDAKKFANAISIVDIPLSDQIKVFKSTVKRCIKQSRDLQTEIKPLKVHGDNFKKWIPVLGEILDFIKRLE